MRALAILPLLALAGCVEPVPAPVQPDAGGNLYEAVFN